MKIDVEMIKKEAEISGLLFLGVGATISGCPLLNILIYGGKFASLCFGNY